jgi:DNA primase
MEGLDFRQALEKLARQAGVELKGRPGESDAAKREHGRLLEAQALAAKYYQATLVKNERALAYVVGKRKLNKETIRDFQIGFAPESWEALTGWLLKKGFSPQELLKCGLAGQKQGRNTVYDLFRNRVMFTICDRDGRPVGFTGRVLDDSEPKYYNTPQTPLYDKSQVIFGLHLAKETIRRANEVVLVEGNMDVIASHQVGVKQVVATSGTALTLDQLRTLSKMTKNVKLSFDSDKAGLAATERAIELGQKLGLTLRMVEMPEGVKDADELCQRDPDLWKQAIASAKYIVDYLFDRFEQDYDLKSLIGKRQYTDRLASTLRRLGDPVERDHYVKILAKKVGVSEDAVREKVESEPSAAESKTYSTGQPLDRNRSQQPARAVVQSLGKPTARETIEQMVLSIALTHMPARIILQDLREQDFSNEANVAMFNALSEHEDVEAEILAITLTDLAKDINILRLVGEQQFAALSPADRSIEAFDLARRLHDLSNRQLKQSLINQLREAETNGELDMVDRLTRKIQTLNEEES